MDRSVDPCTDFYHYSCGGWIKKNPIPPDQARWDVYAKLTEENQRFLWGILRASRQAGARAQQSRDRNRRLFRRLHGRAARREGRAPRRSSRNSTQIAALQSMRDLPALLGTPAPRHRRRTACCSASAPTRTTPIPSRVIAFASAGGLGLPDRDYYIKTDAKSVETRQKYVEHVQKMLELLGEPPRTAKTDAQTVMDDRNRAGQSLAHARGPARSLQAVPQDDARATCRRSRPSFHWSAYFDSVAGSPTRP